MAAQTKQAFLYLDDGYPESRDYDDNYVAVDDRQPRTLLRWLLRLPPARVRRDVPPPRAVRLDATPHLAG